MNHAIHNSIVNFIWGIDDDVLRDVYVRGKYRDVILPMTVIRRFNQEAGEHFMPRDLIFLPVADDIKSGTYLVYDGACGMVTVAEERLGCKGDIKAKAFIHTYGFMASILPYSNADWEKQSIFLNFLIPKLSAPKEEALSRGILEAIDMDSYRVKVKPSLKIGLPDQDAEIGPVPIIGGGRKQEPELDQLSNLIKAFNDQFGNIDWKDGDKIQAKVVADAAYQNDMKNNDKKTVRIEYDAALQRVMIDLLSDNPAFKKWLGDTIFGVTYQQQAEHSETGASHGIISSVSAFCR